MKKAVLTFVHKDSYLLNIQIQQFLYNSPETDIYIHLDKKSEKMRGEIINHDRVFFIKNNVSVTWGDDSMMQALFNSWDEIISLNKSYDYFIMCTGQDLLIKPNLDEFLLQNSDKIWLDTKEGDKWCRMFITRKFPRCICRDLSVVSKAHPLRIFRGVFYRLMKLNLIPKRYLQFDIKNIVFYYSFNWSVIPFYVVKDLYKYINQTSGYRDAYKNTFLPEDRFLGTLIMNSKYAKNVVWSDNEWSKTMTYHTPIEVHPKVFTMEDICEIDKSDCFFARKFDSNIDINVINYYKSKIIK